jgi:hypothetical protein
MPSEPTVVRPSTDELPPGVGVPLTHEYEALAVALVVESVSNADSAGFAFSKERLDPLALAVALPDVLVAVVEALPLLAESDRIEFEGALKFVPDCPSVTQGESVGLATTGS